MYLITRKSITLLEETHRIFMTDFSWLVTLFMVFHEMYSCVPGYNCNPFGVKMFLCHIDVYDMVIIFVYLGCLVSVFVLLMSIIMNSSEIIRHEGTLIRDIANMEHYYLFQQFKKSLIGWRHRQNLRWFEIGKSWRTYYWYPVAAQAERHSSRGTGI